MYRYISFWVEGSGIPFVFWVVSGRNCGQRGRRKPVALWGILAKIEESRKGECEQG